jgi:hypothetical protein
MGILDKLLNIFHTSPEKKEIRVRILGNRILRELRKHKKEKRYIQDNLKDMRRCLDTLYRKGLDTAQWVSAKAEFGKAIAKLQMLYTQEDYDEAALREKLRSIEEEVEKKTA